MLIVRKINYKKYIPLAILTSSVCSIFCQNWTQVGIVFFCALGTYLNQIMLVKGVSHLTSSDTKPKNSDIVFLMIGKVFILFGFLAIGVHFMGNRIIICIINYILLIGVLGISLKRNPEDE